MIKLALASMIFVGTLSAVSAPVRAGDLPLAAGSPIAGITFDDRPLMLPAQRNFQMAMLTASSELGRSCGRMEAYGWRMDASEQDRVNVIFNNTVDRMRAQGFVVESKTSSAVSRDVTLFTADRSDRHLIFLWSAGEIGLVMVLCETSAPLSSSPAAFGREASVEVPSQPATLPSLVPSADTVRRTGSLGTALTTNQPLQLTKVGRPAYPDFSPVGKWIGTYTCAQGTTGATLHVESVKGDQFKGTFSFYPTAKNPYVPKGKYLVFGEYDSETQRVLINPGKWVERPEGFYNTIMIGSFNPGQMTFSGYFQGIMGCTSFEALRSTDERVHTAPEKKKAVKKVPAKKKAAAKKPEPKVETVTEMPLTEGEVSPQAVPAEVTPQPTTPAALPSMPEAGIPLSGKAP